MKRWLLVGFALASLAAGRPSVLVSPSGSPMVPPRNATGAWGGALEHRPIWDRPTYEPSLYWQASAASERANLISNPTLRNWILATPGQQMNIQRSTLNAQRSTVLNEWDRQLALQRATDKARAARSAAAKFEVESQVLAAERDRWWREQAKPRQEEAAIVDRQYPEKKR